MVFDTLEHSAQYEKFSARFQTAFAFLCTHWNAFETMSPGTYEIDGRDVFFKIQTYETNAINDCRFESHQLYADIHCIVSGTEVAGCKSIGSCEILKPYDASLDVALWEPSAENARVILQQGTFLIAFPTEVHFTGGMYKGKDSVKKVLMKVKL